MAALAMLPKRKSYFVVDLVRRGRTHHLPQRWRSNRAAVLRIDDAALRREGGGKIDWSSLSSAQREALLGELDSARLVIRE